MIKRIKTKKDKDWISWRKRKEIIDVEWTYTELEFVSSNFEANKLKEKFGKNVRRIRELRNISQEKLAAKAWLHRTYISDVERGKKNISIENIGKIAKALNMKVHSLMNFWARE
jgi:ribosome-binding protein aMBF1 (putative translation factor)